MLARGTTVERVPAVAKTAPILRLVAVGQQADPSVPLLIHGETGTGKDTVACLVHEASTRSTQAFIKVNLKAPSCDNHEADLFGHERGASAEATRRRLGSFEFAHHGTIYLDGVGPAPSDQIARMVRAARTGEVSRIGSDEIRRVDVRLIASTSDDPTERANNYLWQALRGLGAVEICVPPLRERTDEIPVLASVFLERLNRQYHRHVQLCPDVLSAFMTHSWAGNIRELEEAVHRLFVGEAAVPVH